MTDIKSQDDLNAQGRETDVLIATIMKCQELVKEKVELENENKRLKELLKECKTKINELLKKYAELDEDGSFEHGCKWSEQEFKQENKGVYELLSKIEEALK